MNASENGQPDSAVQRPDAREVGKRGAVIAIAATVIVGVSFRLLGINWLIGVGNEPDFSFHWDEERFVIAAKWFESASELLGGYVRGMASQLFLLKKVFAQLAIDPNLLTALRWITVVHASLTILATYFLARIWFPDRRVGLLAAILLALCPLHIVNSNYGTADVAAVNLFYLTFLAGIQYLRTEKPVWFMLTTIACGAAIAVKFFIPLLGFLAVLLMLERKGSRFERALTCAFGLAGSFWVASLFSYTLWDFGGLFQSLLHGNLNSVEGKSPLQNSFLYPWRLIPSLSIPVFVLAVIGVLGFAVRTKQSGGRANQTSALHRFRSILRSPLVLLLVPLALHAGLIIRAGSSSSRHLLVFMPALCVLAAAGFMHVTSLLPKREPMRLVLAGMLVAYLGYLTVGIQELFRGDIRRNLMIFSDDLLRDGHRVYAGDYYTAVKGTGRRSGQPFDPGKLADDDYVLTCDLQFERYLRHADAEDMHHPHGGQSSVDFFREVMLDHSKFKVVAAFDQAPLTLEQRMIVRGWLPPLETYTPGRCFVLGTQTQLDPELRASMLENVRQLVARKQRQHIRYGGPM
jgi:hypothetical protein